MSFLPSISPGNVPNIAPSDWTFDINDINGWERPTEWLDLNVPDGIPEKIIGLVAVFPDDERPSQNYVVFNLDTVDSSSYTVNWGDGNSETVNSNTTIIHEYDYDDLPSSTEFRGYRQAKFEVTLASGAEFGGSNGQINFDIDGPYVTNASYAYRTGPNILDLFISSSNATTHTINYNRPMRMLEQLEIRNTSSNRLTNPQRLYCGCRSLRSIPFVPYIYNSGTRDYLRAFYHCHSLTSLPDDFADPTRYWFKNPTRIYETFSHCHSLAYLPEGLFGDDGSTLSSCYSWYRAFYECRVLKNIPYIGMRDTADMDVRYMFANCNELRAIPRGFNISRITSSGIYAIFQSCTRCRDWSVFTDAGGLDAIERTGNFTFLNSFFNLDSLKVFPYVGQFTRANDATQMFYAAEKIERFDSQYTHLDLTNCRDMFRTFYAMGSLKELPPIHVGPLTNSSSLRETFYNDYSLTSVKFVGMTTGPSDGEYFRMFYNCWSIQNIEGVNFSFANDSGDYSQMFNLVRNLSYIKFPGGPTDETGFKYSISLRYCPLNRDALLEIFNHLVTISHSATLTLTNNSYTSDLTADDKLIATNKGWTLSL